MPSTSGISQSSQHDGPISQIWSSVDRQQRREEMHPVLHFPCKRTASYEGGRSESCRDLSENGELGYRTLTGNKGYFLRDICFSSSVMAQKRQVVPFSPLSCLPARRLLWSGEEVGIGLPVLLGVPWDVWRVFFFPLISHLRM